MGTININNANQIDFSRISSNAADAMNQDFIPEANVMTEYWGDEGDLTAEEYGDGIYIIKENGVPMGFTDTLNVEPETQPVPNNSAEAETQQVPNNSAEAETQQVPNNSAEAETQQIPEKPEIPKMAAPPKLTMQHENQDSFTQWDGENHTVDNIIIRAMNEEQIESVTDKEIEILRNNLYNEDGSLNGEVNEALHQLRNWMTIKHPFRKITIFGPE